MTIDFGQLSRLPAPAIHARTGPPEAAAPARVRESAPSGRFQMADSVEVGIPSSPPPGVLEEIAAAAALARALAEANLELHFQADEKSGRIIVEVRDFDGNVVRTIPPSKAIDVMAGLYGVDRA